MLQPLNRIEKVFRETLFTKSAGEAFQRLCEFYGFPRPLLVQPDDWREALHRTVFAARDTPGVVFLFLEAVFDQWTRECSTFTATGVSVNILDIPEVTESMEGRFCRINGRLYRSQYLRDGTTEMVFVPFGTTTFDAADFEALTEYEVAFLPFDIKEYGARYTILIDDGIFGFPPTYLKQDADDIRGEGEPFGGHIMDFFSSDEGERVGDLLDGPHPLYFGDDDFTQVMETAFENMFAAGVIEKVQAVRWVEGVSSVYGSIYNRRVYGTTSPTPPDIINPSRG